MAQHVCVQRETHRSAHTHTRASITQQQNTSFIITQSNDIKEHMS
jgi:hypothetical protein